MSAPLDLQTLRGTGRDDRGRWTRGNLGALDHGLDTPVDHPALVAAHRERVEAITADLGGMSQLSALQIPLVRELARLQLVAASLGEDVLAKGVMTAKGRTRAAVTLWLQVVERQQRLAERIGLERRAKPAGPTHLADYLEAK